jgi:hypothetical protein
VHVPVGVGTYEISVFDGARRIASPTTLRSDGREEPKTPTRLVACLAYCIVTFFASSPSISQHIIALFSNYAMLSMICM